MDSNHLRGALTIAPISLNSAMDSEMNVKKPDFSLLAIDEDQNTNESPITARDKDGEGPTVASTVITPATESHGISSKDNDAGNGSVHIVQPVNTSEMPRKGVPMPITIKQHLNGDEQLSPIPIEPTNSPFGDAVQWETLIYDRERELRYPTEPVVAVVKYVDVRPMDLLSPMSKSKKGGMNNADDASKWTGPIIIIQYTASAWLPHIRCTYPKTKSDKDETALSDTGAGREHDHERQRRGEEAVALIHNEDDLPKTLADHDLEHCSHPTMIIKSPHLYQELSDLVTDYPYHFQDLDDFPSDFGETVWFPYVPLLHFYPKILQRLSAPISTTKSTVSTTERPVQTSVLKPFERDFELARSHLKILQMYLQPLYESKVLAYREALSAPDPSASFDMLLNVFPPGTAIYVTDVWTPWYAAVVSEISFGRPDDKDQWTVWFWVLTSDGVQMLRHEKSVVIEEYDGVKQLTSLSLCPTSIWDAVRGDSRRKQAVERGKLLEMAFRRGHLLATYSGADSTGDSRHTGKVVVDQRRGAGMTGIALDYSNPSGGKKDPFLHYDEIYLNHPWAWAPEDLSWRNEMRASLNPERHTSASGNGSGRARKAMPMTACEEHYGYKMFPRLAETYEISAPLTDEQLLLIYPLTFGFSLKSKTWLELDATYLKYVPPSERSMKNLVLANSSKEEGNVEKEIIKALAARLKRPKTWSADHIEGKGAGVIILLHGPPGVGKTYTVESIAEMLQRPLLALSVADIGTVETAIERELSKWFALAELWGAVLLIDEADVFLERRQTKDLARNGLVSAFLRRAEYFSGLLFLTTNRVGQIDDAFISRVHVALRYSNLKPAEQAQIWQGFFDRLSDDKSAKIRLMHAAKTWVINEFEQGKYDGLNGRDIRNALQTAITLAKYEEECDPEFNVESDTVTVTDTHFRRVLDMSHGFRRYVDSIRSQDEKKRASERGDRNDYVKGELSIRDKIRPAYD